MDSSPSFVSDLPPWFRDWLNEAWKYRDWWRVIAPVAIVLVVIISSLVSKFSPSDLEQAEEDCKLALSAIIAMEEEAFKLSDEAEKLKKRIEDNDALIEKWKDTPDTTWLEWRKALGAGHDQVRRAKWSRYDTLLHLAAQNTRLLAEARTEILRSKNSRDRGTPYLVRPRVQELLAPILARR